MSNNLTRGTLHVIGNDPVEINAIFQRIRDELDEIQGLRGRTFIFDRTRVGSPVETGDAARLEDIPGISTFIFVSSSALGNLIKDGRVVRFIDENGTLIHSFGTSD